MTLPGGEMVCSPTINPAEFVCCVEVKKRIVEAAVTGVDSLFSRTATSIDMDKWSGVGEQRSTTVPGIDRFTNSEFKCAATDDMIGEIHDAVVVPSDIGLECRLWAVCSMLW